MTTNIDRTLSESPGSDEGVSGAAQAVAGSAQEQAGAVADTAKEQATAVAGQAKEHLQGLAQQANQQLSGQAAEQTTKLSGSLRSLSTELSSMAESGSPGTTAHSLVSEAASRSGRFAEYLDGRDPTDLLDDLRRFGSRRPGAFLVGAGLAGLLVARFGKAVRSDAGTSDGADAAGLPTNAGASTTSGVPPTTAAPDLASATHGAPTVTAPMPLPPTVEPPR